mgnify:FL=1
MKRLALILLPNFALGLALGLALGWSGGPLLADGVVIDKIYHPYVQPLEREFEWRATLQDRQPGRPDDLQVYRMAYGMSLGEKWFAKPTWLDQLK